MSILRSKHSGWTHEGRRTPYFGGGGGGSPAPTQTTSYSTNVPEYARPYVENMLESTQKQIYTDDMAGFRPYRPYSTDVNQYFAGFSPMQQQAQQATANLQTPGQYGTATGLAGMSGMGGLGLAGQMAGAGQQYAQMATSPAAQQAYMSPYMQNVVDYQKSQALRDYQIGAPMRARAAIGAGAFGGSRQAIESAEAQRNLMSQLQGIEAQGRQSAFQQAQQAQQFGANLGLQGQQGALGGLGAATQAAGALGQLGGQQLGAQKEIIGLQSQMGREQQALEQNKINQAIQDYAIAQQYPFMQLGMMNAMLRGLPLQTQTTQLYQAQPSALQQGIGLVGAGSTLFGGRAAGGAIKEYREGGIVGYAPGGVIDSTRAKLEQIADMPGGIQKLEQIRNSSTSEEVREMATEIIVQKQMEAQAEQQAQKGRMSGIAMAGGPAFESQGMAGGGIIAFSNGGVGMTDPEFGGGEQSVDARKPRTIEELFREYPGLEGNVGRLQLADYVEGRSAPPESARAKPAPVAAPAPAAAAAPKPETKPPAARPEGGAPVDRGIAALTGIKSLEEQMREQERLMGPNTVNEGLNAKIAERLAGLSKQEKQDELAAIRRAFIEFGTTASPGGMGVAALKGIGSYGDARDAAKKARESMDLELTKMQADIKKAERAEKRGNLDAAAKSYESAENRQLRLAEMQNQLKAAGISASRPSDFEKQYALYAEGERAAGRTPSFEGFKRASSLQDDAAKQRANQEAVKAFTSQEFINFGGDKKYIDLKKAAQSGDEKAVKDFNDYRMQKFQSIRNMMLNPEEAIGGGSVAVPQGVTVKKVG
jgi:hypothetical protein